MVSNVAENLVERLVSRLGECLRNEKVALISGENVDSHFIYSFVPQKVKWTKNNQELFIESEDFTLKVENIESVEYDEYEDVYFVKQKNTIFSFTL